MREIKFRAWDRKEKVMLNWDKKPYLFFFIGDYGDILKGAFDDLKGKELMQYTGLKDKNGKEIYEGDIYIHHAQYGFFAGDKHPYVIESLQDFFETKGLGEGEYGDDYSQIEVIGNIYENPELIK